MEKAGALAVKVLTIFLFLVSAAAFALPKIWTGILLANERSASTNLKMLPSANATYRANDLDGNRVNDFWTADVAGLQAPNPSHPPLFARGIAEADVAPLSRLVPRPIALQGYYFRALDRDLGLFDRPSYRQDTDKSGRQVHNTGKFGYCAFPASYGFTGRFTYLVNENNTVFRVNIRGEPFIDWPDDDTIAALATKTPPTDLVALGTKISYFVAGLCLILGIVIAVSGKSATGPKE